MKKEVRFDLSDNALYVANSGRPFTRKGVIGICASHLSEKRNNPSDSYECTKKDLTCEILERQIRTYKNDRDRVLQDANLEGELRHDYDGRFAWELLQNADDVMGPSDRHPAELIGAKGLGFKSVLEITEEPEIHSGLFNFRFSPDETERLLKCEGIEAPPRLTFRIPHSCEPNDKVCELQDMGYSTVIRLPFQDGSRETAKKVLEDLDPCFLLLSQQIETVRIVQDGDDRVFTIQRENDEFSDDRLVLEGPDGKTSWRRWVEKQDIDEDKRITVAVTIPLDGNGKAVPHTDELRFHVFFPTEEQFRVKTLVHASFDLEQNRKHLRQGEYDEAILGCLGELLERLILEIPPQTVLEVFGDLDPPKEDDGKLIDKIKRTIWEKMKTTPFVSVLGDERVCPPDSTCWKGKLGDVLREDEMEVQEAALVTPSLSNFSSILRKLGASGIDDSKFVKLLRYCRNEILDDCIASFHVLLKDGLDKVQDNEEALKLLRRVPCWWTEDGRARQLNDSRPLLLKKPKDWPDWLDVDTLHPEFRTEIEEWEKQDKESPINQGQFTDYSKIKKWENLIEGFVSSMSEHYVDWALLPHIERWDEQTWEKQGFDVLKWLMRWESQHKFKEILPYIRGAEENKEDRRRNRLATIPHLPTDKGWLPAIDCFAGKAWDGPKAFDRFYQDRIIRPFEKWPDELQKTDKDKSKQAQAANQQAQDGLQKTKDTWKGLLRWIGVSWEPKVFRTRSFVVRHNLWDGYKNKYSAWHTGRKPGHNYCIEDFPECVCGIERDVLIRDIFPPLQELSSKKASWYRNKDKTVDSLAFYQLTHKAWLPVKKSLLGSQVHIPPNEAFLPGEGLPGLLPEVDKSGIDDDAWYGKDGISAKLVRLGVSSSETCSSVKWHDWMRDLAGVGKELKKEEQEAPVDWKDREAKVLWSAARRLYRKYLENGDFGTFPEDIQIPCVRFYNNKRLIDFTRPEQVHWIDEPYLAGLTLERELLRQGYKLFIFRLQDNTANISKLRVSELSGTIECTPQYSECSDEGRRLSQRYKDRRIALNKLKNIQLPEDVEIKAVRNLRLKLSANGDELGDCSVLSWKDSGTGQVLVDIEKNKWHALADALAYRLQKDYSQYANDFEVYLLDSDGNIVERLRSAGIPEEALEEVKETIQLQNSVPVEANSEEDEDQAKWHEKNNKGLEQPHIFGPAISGVTKSENGGATGYWAGSGGRSRLSRAGGYLSSPGNNSALLPETGLPAEEWLGDRLREKFEDSVDKVSTGSDFMLEHNGQKIYIEAKHIENLPGSIHWSDRQFKTCCDNKNRYFIALLSPGREDGDYAIHWIWAPLESLMKLDRNVIWKTRSKPLQEDSWEIPEPPELPANSFKEIVITLADDVFNSENRDNRTLEKLAAKIR